VITRKLKAASMMLATAQSPNIGRHHFCRAANAALATKDTINTESFAAEEAGVEATLPISAVTK